MKETYFDPMMEKLKHIQNFLTKGKANLSKASQVLPNVLSLPLPSFLSCSQLLFFSAHVEKEN